MAADPNYTRTTWPLWVGVAVLVVASTLGHLSGVFGAQGHRAASLRAAVDLDSEANLPTWFASALLILLAANLRWVSRAWRDACRGGAWRWSMLALIALAMSTEEVAGLHERSIVPLRTLLGTGGPLYFAWVLPGMALVCLVGALCLPLLWSTPGAARDRLALGAGVYVLGAIGFEMVGGVFAPPLGGERSAAYLAITTVEETLEMAGLIIAVGALLRLRATLSHEAENIGMTRGIPDADSLKQPATSRLAA